MIKEIILAKKKIERDFFFFLSITQREWENSKVTGKFCILQTRVDVLIEEFEAIEEYERCKQLLEIKQMNL